MAFARRRSPQGRFGSMGFRYVRVFSPSPAGINNDSRKERSFQRKGLLDRQTSAECVGENSLVVVSTGRERNPQSVIGRLLGELSRPILGLLLQRRGVVVANPSHVIGGIFWEAGQYNVPAAIQAAQIVFHPHATQPGE